MSPRFRIGAGALLGVMLFTSCGADRSLQSSPVAADDDGYSAPGAEPTKETPVAERGTETPVPELLVDSEGYRYEVAASIERVGQRLDPDAFISQLKDGKIARNGYTFGLGDTRDPEQMPDLVASLDVNGSGTIVGFIKAGPEFLMMRATPPETLIYGSDGRTVVGRLLIELFPLVMEDGTTVDATNETFVPEEK